METKFPEDFQRDSNLWRQTESLQNSHQLFSRTTSYLHGCETWTETLKEEQSLVVFANNIWRLLGPRREEVTEEQKKITLREALKVAFHQVLLC